jgi:predicted P-loop ATPase
VNSREAAKLYISRGWYPIPLNPGTKECRDADWKERIYSEDEFSENDNLGLRLIRESDPREVKLIGIDLDAQECVDLASAFLPVTKASWGRESKAISQALYLSPFDRSYAFKDWVSGSMLVEIRVDHQSMAPPSVHPNGEMLKWHNDELEPAKIDPKELKRHVQLLATSALIARHYPGEGDRHERTLALAGALRQFSLNEDEALEVISSAAKLNADKKIKDRRTEIKSTFSKNEDDPVVGTGKLTDLMGEMGRLFVESLRRIWSERSPFKTDGKSKKVLANDQANIKRAIEKLEVKFSFDEFARKIHYKNGVKPDRILDESLFNHLWLDLETRFGFRPTRELFDIIVRDVADQAKFHPVRDYLASLKWDGVKRIDNWLHIYGGAEENEYTNAVGRLFLLAAVRRARHPGCKFDELLVLESPQGHNKSSALRALCPDEDWFTDDFPLGIDSKQVIERTAGKWIIEAAELVNMRKAQVEQLKSFLSRQTDGPVRLAYERQSTEISRQFVVVGTTNAAAYLKDYTGNRRFWPVRVRMFNVALIDRDRDQIWAEAAQRDSDGESIRLDPKLYADAGAQQERRRTEDPWEPVLTQAIEDNHDAKQRFTSEELWQLLNIPLERRDERGADRISAVMQSHGFRRNVPVRRGDKIIKGWGRDLIDGIWRPAGWNKE